MSGDSFPLDLPGHAAVAERQTRELQVLVSERTWGFESPPPHSLAPMAPIA